MNKIITFILFGFVLVGCSGQEGTISSQEGVICFEPIEPYEPESGAELLEEFNSQLPFNVKPKNFICKYKSDSDTLVAWIITNTIEQKDIIKEKLKQSSTLKVLQVESLSPEMKALFKNQWRQSQTVSPPDK